ncbi:MAG: hypothetical protein OEV44_02855 [Spirochaetota bacterium]|nr:hypothetical protein [Spirochaetota bacterium]
MSNWQDEKSAFSKMHMENVELKSQIEKAEADKLEMLKIVKRLFGADVISLDEQKEFKQTIKALSGKKWEEIK